MTRERFEVIAQQAFDSLPEKFRERIENVHIVVEDYPSDELAGRGGRNRFSLLGLYQGVPLTKRGTWYGASPTVPDKITLFQRNIEDACHDENEIQQRIVEVLFHEIGHYFGMNEAQIRSAMKDFNP
jgi:predicted Zn-dependent protease with MMP-like domain